MIHFYHPNRANKGFASSFYRDPRNDTVFATIIKQSGWDNEKQNGIFRDNKDNPEGRANIKLDYVEVAGILDCIERGRDFKNFHESNETPKNISFTVWKGQDGNPKGYSFSILVTNKQDPAYKNSFYIGFTYAEARLIREFFIYALHAHFQHRVTNSRKAYTPPAPVEATAVVEAEPEAAVEETPVEEAPAAQEEAPKFADPLIDF